jgi:hypothetical protein
MNIAFGPPTPEAMPFDLRHLRNPILYDCAADADDETRSKVKQALSKDLKRAILEVLSSEAFLGSLKFNSAYQTSNLSLELGGRQYYQSRWIQQLLLNALMPDGPVHLMRANADDCRPVAENVGPVAFNAGRASATVSNNLGRNRR